MRRRYSEGRNHHPWFLVSGLVLGVLSAGWPQELYDMHVCCENCLDVTQCNFCPSWMVCDLEGFKSLKFSLLCWIGVLSLFAEWKAQATRTERSKFEHTYLTLWTFVFGGAKSAEASFGLCLSCWKLTFTSERFLHPSPNWKTWQARTLVWKSTVMLFWTHLRGHCRFVCWVCANAHYPPSQSKG